MARQSEFQQHLTTVVVPIIAAAAMGVRYRVAGDVSVALLVAVALSPVWLAALTRFRGMRPLLAIGAVAVLTGWLLTVTDPARTSSTSLLITQTIDLASLVAGVGTLLWARLEIGQYKMAGAYGAGLLASAVLTGLPATNPWKFSLGVPLTILVLAWAAQSRKWILEVVALGVLCAVSLGADSRSAMAMLLLTAIIVIWQRRSGRVLPRRARPWATLLLLGGVALAVFQLVQALVLEGALGEAAAQRSQLQIQESGSVITGGRPELGAAVALLGRQFWGYGSGVVPTSQDVWIAKTGMSGLNYDPNNGYVENYMFGTGFEVHSVLGDLWIRFGLPGALFALVAVAYCIYAVAVRLSTRSASSVLVWLTLQATWNLFFSPILGSSRTFGLGIAVAAVVATVPVRDGPTIAAWPTDGSSAWQLQRTNDSPVQP